jgi:hypothetical protein
MKFKALLNFTISLAPTTPIPQTTVLTPPPLIPGTFCRDFRECFTQSGSRCVLGSRFSADVVHLHVMDIECNLLGQGLVEVGKAGVLEVGGERIGLERLMGGKAPVFLYEGWKFGGDGRECWVDGEEGEGEGQGEFSCAQVFEC